MISYFQDQYEIGIDEAGRGPLIGRVYAAAVILGEMDDKKREEIKHLKINDSKKMTPRHRERAEKWIVENVRGYAVSFSEASEIDKINILEATKKAMQRAVDEISSLSSLRDSDINRLIIDGCRWEDKIWEKKSKESKGDKDGKERYEVHSVVKGDATYLSIAMASILAKQYHDRYITELCREHPYLHERYDLLNNMGYGTKRHIEGIKKYGLSDFHRRSFKLKNL